MAIDFAPEFGTKFTLIGPTPRVGDAPEATFNDTTDPNDVGVLTEDISGLDSAEVRDSGEDIVEFDGAVQGPNWFGARPLVMSGLIYGHDTKEERAAKIARLDAASKAMRSDGQLIWTPSVTDAVPVYLNVRRQQPLRISGGWNKTFQCSLVARDPRIYSVELFSGIDYVGAEVTVDNEGNSEAFPTYVLMGPMTGVHVWNDSAQAGISTSADLELNDALVIDTLRRTVHLGARNPESRRNYFFDPSFEGTATTSLTALPNNTSGGFDRHASQPSPSSGDGSKVLKWNVSTIDPKSMLVIYTGSTGDGEANFALEPSATHVSVSVDMMAGASTTNRPRVDVDFFDDSLAFIGAVSGVRSASVSSGAWTRETLIAEIPPGATQAIPSFGVNSASGNTTAMTLYADKFLFEQHTTDPATNPEVHSFFYPDSHSSFWESTEMASESIQLSQELDPSVPLVPAFATVDFDATTWTGLQPGENVLQVLSTPGLGAFFKVQWRHTWL